MHRGKGETDAINPYMQMDMSTLDFRLVHDFPHTEGGRAVLLKALGRLKFRS